MIAHYLAICGPKRWPHILGLLYLGSYPTPANLAFQYFGVQTFGFITLSRMLNE